MAEQSTKQPSADAVQRPLHEIYAQPAPIRTFPLPAFYPNNPISLFHIAYAWLEQIWSRPEQPVYEGVWSPTTFSIHITDEKSTRALWEQGFYGKGSLSRSEPNWLKREKVRRGLQDAHVSEILTVQRREERIRAKWERARLEQEAIRQTRLEEAREAQAATREEVASPVTPEKLLSLPNSADPPIYATKASAAASLNDASDSSASANQTDTDTTPGSPSSDDKTVRRKSVRFSPEVKSTTFGLLDPPSPKYSLSQIDLPGPMKEPLPDTIVNKEHLQLMPEEAFFLSFGFGALRVTDSGKCLSQMELLTLFRQCSYFPRIEAENLQPDDKFLVHYSVYHHFRSLGWVPRGGIKFGVDWLLYTRGPVFDHAEFGLIVIPSYSDPLWKQVGKETPQKSWQSLHATIRVLSHVMKSLVLVYVDIPPPTKFDAALEKGLPDVFKLYKVREMMVKRWSSNRNR